MLKHLLFLSWGCKHI